MTVRRDVRPLVVVDADVLGRRRTGDESYVENLLSEFAAASPADLRIAAVARDIRRIPEGIEPIMLSTPGQIRRLLWSLPRALRRAGPALAHFQYFVPPAYRGPSVVTVHDLSFEEFPQFFAAHDRVAFRTLVPRAVRRAAAVLTVSEWTKTAIVERYHVPPDRVIVTPNGVDPAFTPEGRATPGSPYVLFVGAIQPRKDPTTAIEALARLDGDLRLVMAGPEKRRAEEIRALVRRRGLEGRVDFRGYVDKDELAALYRGARCLVFPSRYEGFGLPVLEAMACGTPVVATRATSIPEVAGEAAILVPSGDPGALADGIRTALTRRDALRAAGIARAAAFSWRETARLTLETYRLLTR